MQGQVGMVPKVASALVEGLPYGQPTENIPVGRMLTAEPSTQQIMGGGRKLSQ